MIGMAADRRSNDALQGGVGMSLNVEDMPERLRVVDVRPGDVFRNQRGVLMVVVAVQGNGDASLLMFNEGGGICGVQRYGVHYLRDKKRVGSVANLPDVLEVEWSMD